MADKKKTSLDLPSELIDELDDLAGILQSKRTALIERAIIAFLPTVRKEAENRVEALHARYGKASGKPKR